MSEIQMFLFQTLGFQTELKTTQASLDLSLLGFKPGHTMRNKN